MYYRLVDIFVYLHIVAVDHSCQQKRFIQQHMSQHMRFLFDFVQFLANVNYDVAHLSVVCLSVVLVHPTQPIESFYNFSTPFGTLTIH